MTLLGKIFTVLIFIMSLVFMSFAVAVYATHRNWRDLVINSEATAVKPLGLKPQLNRSQEENERIQRELDEVNTKLSMERAARRQVLAALESHRSQLVAQLQEKERTNATLVERERNAISAMDSTQNNLTRLKDEVDKLRDEIRVTQLDRDTQFGSVVKTTDQLHQLSGTQKRLEERRQVLAGQVARMQVVLDKHGLNIHTPLHMIPPPLDGEVLAVSKKNLVEVSLGSDDGLREGHFLDVSRGNSYLGRIIVRRTAPDRAVAEIIPDLRKGLIQRGDRVVTKS